MNEISSSKIKETIVRNYYRKYLEEAFDLDKPNYNNFIYIIRGKARSQIVIPQKNINNFYDTIGKFKDGYARVTYNNKVNFINQDGSILSEEWFDEAKEFSGGLAMVTKNKLSNFINTDGEFLFKEWQLIKQGEFYPNGVGIVEYSNSKPKIFDTNGKELFSNIPDEEKFYKINPFIGNYAVAKKFVRPKTSNLHFTINFSQKKCCIIDCKGNCLETYYDDIVQLDENVFMVSSPNNQDYKMLIDANGKRIGKEDFNTVSPKCFVDDYLIVTKDGKNNLLDREGNLKFKKWRSYIKPSESLDPPKNKIKNVYKCDTKYIDENENILSYFEVEEAYKKNQGISIKLEREPLSYNYVYPDGRKFFASGKEYLTSINNGVFGCKEDDIFKIYSVDGNEITSFKSMYFFDFFNNGQLEAIEKSPKLELAQSTRKWFHYVYEKDNTKYLLDYKAVVDYGDIIICESSDTYYVYSKATQNTVPLGKKEDIKLNTNYIIISGKKYFISGIDFVDITDLPFKNKISLKDGVKKLLTFEDFKSLCNQPEYQNKIQNEIETLKQDIEKERQSKIIEEANQRREKEQQKIAEKKESLKNSLNNLSEILAQCSKYIDEIETIASSNNYKRVNVPKEILLIPVADHFEINPIFLQQGLLRFINLSTISFKDVKISGIDLSYTNARINPQEVYNKDMSNGKYCGLDFNLCNFDGVNIENADFSESILDFAQGIENKEKGL